MKIVGLCILPPLAIGRLGSAAEPLENYELKTPDDGLGFRRIVPANTLYIDDATGGIREEAKPTQVRFRDGDRIRPVAPFLEVFAYLDDGSLAPLSLDVLGAKRAEDIAIRWRVEVGNIKAFRRTGNPDDKALATIEFSDFAPHALRATAVNFLPGKTLPLGHVRYIRPTEAFPEIRMRFSPAKGIVYGAQKTRKAPTDFDPDHRETDPILVSDDQIIYNPNGPWVGWADKGEATDTNPGQIYAGFTNQAGVQESWGYLDDECDGIVTVYLTLSDGRTLSAFARIGAGPPSFAPDGFPVRSVHDDLLQALLGKDTDPAQVGLPDAEDIVRRAAETVRLMNTAVMNGNAVNGVVRPASMMPTQDSNDTHRAFEPIVGAGIADARAILALHQSALAALRSGTAPWFPDLLRKPEDIGDLSDAARRKMPALMRGADGRYLALTRRQIDVIAKVASAGVYARPASATPANLTAIEAQLAYRGRGNPPVTHPISAISNCFPGLEFDFRNIWRRLFKGIVLTEHNNYVVEVEDTRLQNLLNCRLLAVNEMSVTTQAKGPPFPGGDPTTLLTTAGSPEAVAFMEWSNSFARFQDKQGQIVNCTFTAVPPTNEMEFFWPRPPGDTLQTVTIKLEVRRLFDVEQMADGRRQRAALARELAEPGELTQGLCSPWQNDYRECACYYWAASRPDFVNVEPGPEGASRGAMWMQKRHEQPYIPDTRADPRLVSYDDLFAAWERQLRFVVGGRTDDAPEAFGV